MFSTMFGKSRKVLVIALLLVILSLAAQVTLADPSGSIEDVDHDGCVVTVETSGDEKSTYYMYLFSISGPGILFAAFDGDSVTEFVVDEGFTEGDAVAQLYDSHFNFLDYAWVRNIPYGCTGNAGDEEGTFNPNDGRINVQAYATFTVICEADAIKVFPLDVNTGNAGIGFSIPLADIPAEAPAANTLLASNGGVSVYHQSTGDIMVVGPTIDNKAYVFGFNGCPVSSWTAGTLEGEIFTPSESA